MGSNVSVQGTNPAPLMSALDQKQTFSDISAMSALPPKADLQSSSSDVRFVPIGNIRQPRRDPELLLLESSK